MHMVISNAYAGDPYDIDTLIMYMANMSWNSSMNTSGVMKMLTDKDENGNYVIGNCHAGPGQPLLVEVVPSTKKVVWQLDRYEDFGNNVSNSILLDQVGKAVR